MAQHVTPSLNCVYADTRGNIGYALTGKVPLRPRQEPSWLPLEGWNAAHDWTGTIPFDEMPATLQPSGRHRRQRQQPRRGSGLSLLPVRPVRAPVPHRAHPPPAHAREAHEHGNHGPHPTRHRSVQAERAADRPAPNCVRSPAKSRPCAPASNCSRNGIATAAPNQPPPHSSTSSTTD